MISVSPGEKGQGAAMGGKAVFASLKRTNATAIKHSNHHAVHSAVHIEPRTTSWRGREQNFPLTNAAGLCRAAGELPARETIRRGKEMEKESNYPSAKTDARPDTGPSPGQADVGSDVCRLFLWWGWETAPGGALWDSRWSSTHPRELGQTGRHTAAFSRNTGLCWAPRDSPSQPGTAVLCGDGGGARQSCAGAKGGG